MPDWIYLGDAIDPRDQQPGDAYRTIAMGDVLFTGRDLRQLPPDWREHQKPKLTYNKDGRKCKTN